MEEKKQFYRLLKPVKRQLFVKGTLREFHYWVVYALIFSVVFLMAARIFVIPFYHEMIWSGCFLLLPIFVYRIWRNRPVWRDAALLFNSFVPEDRVITALSFLDVEGVLQKLQLSEAVKLMKKEQQRVLARKKSYFSPKCLIIAIVFVCLSIVLNYLPNQNFQLAAKKETEMAVMKKVEKKLEEKAKKETNAEMKKTLEKAREIISKNPEPKQALEALAKEKKELELKALKEQEKLENLNFIKQELKNADLSKLAAALEEKDIEKVTKELEQLSKKDESLTESEKQALSKLTGSDKKLSEKEIAKLTKQISAALNSDKVMKEFADAQMVMGETADSLQNEMLANGLQSKQLALNPSSNQSTEGKPNGQNNQNGNPQAGSQGSNQGQQSPGNGSQGNGNGSQGNGSGSGNGNGSGTGSGTGSGSGNGSGAGLGSGSRQLLMIPEKLAGKNNLETDTGTIGKGSPTEQYAGNGPILKGKLRPYQEVYGNYADAYRKSTNRVKLPSDLEEVVKNYYLSLDPNKE